MKTTKMLMVLTAIVTLSSCASRSALKEHEEKTYSNFMLMYENQKKISDRLDEVIDIFGENIKLNSDDVDKLKEDKSLENKIKFEVMYRDSLRR